MTVTIKSVKQYSDGSLVIEGTVDGTRVVAAGDVARLDRQYDESVKIRTDDGRTFIPNAAPTRGKTAAEAKAYFERLLTVQKDHRSTRQLLVVASSTAISPVPTSEQHPLIAGTITASTAPVESTPTVPAGGMA